jgi:predicted MFS family arabinose efflux permease
LNARELRLLFLVAGAIVFVDTMFYAAVVPLLPTLTHELHLSKASAGVLTAGYAAGTLVGSIPGGMLAAGAGPRTTIYIGLLLMSASSLAFAFLDHVLLLDAARFVQGFGGACTWAGSLTWLIGEVPTERRGSTIGGALAAAIGGALFGPVLGTLAHAVGRGPVFSAVVVVAGALAVAAAVLPAPSPSPSQPGVRRVLAQLARPTIALGMWLVALPAIASGMLNVLAPLRLSALGASAAGIGATFLVAAGAEACVSPAVGRVSDERGRIYPLRIGLAAAAIVLASFTLFGSVVPVAGVVVLAAVALGSFWAPAMAMLSDAAESSGIGLGYAMALINLAWAAGQVVGAGGGGALAKATGDGVPFVISAVLCAATLGLMVVRPVRVALPR